MTVCIAAISQDRILCVGDRRITHGDPNIEAQFESDSGGTKLFRFRGTVLMYSGELTLVTDVAARAGKALMSQGVLQPKPEDVALAYSKTYNAIREERIDASVLGKWGVTRDDFTKRRTEIRPAILREITQAIGSFEMEYLEVLVAGVTEDGPDLWWGWGPEVRNVRGKGYIAIGSGALHVNSHFELGKYHRRMPRAEAALLMYGAKRIAERAPGVGPTTDIFELGPAPFSVDYHFEIGPAILGMIYDGYLDDERAAREKAALAIENHMPTVPPQAAASATSPNSDTTSRSDQT